MKDKLQFGRRWALNRFLSRRSLWEAVHTSRRSGAGKTAQEGAIPPDGERVDLIEDPRASLEAVMQSLPDGLSIYDADGRLLFRNPAARRILGLAGCNTRLCQVEGDHRVTIRDAQGRPVPADQCPAVRALRGEHVHNFEAEIWVDGQRMGCFAISAVPIGAHNPAGAVVMHRDISALRESLAEQERLLSEVEAGRGLLQAVLAHEPNGVALFREAELTLEICNPAFERLVRLRSPVTPGQKAADILVGSALEPYLSSLAEVVRTGKALYPPSHYVESAGSPLWLLLHLLPVPSDGTREPGVLAVVSDVTQQVKARQRLELLSEAAALFNSSVDLDEVCQHVARHLSNTLGGLAIINLLDGEGPELRAVAVAHQDPDQEACIREALVWEPMRSDQGMTGVALTERKPILVEDVAKANLVGGQRVYADAIGLTSILAVPLISRGQVLGALSLGTVGDERRYDQEDLALAWALAQHAATAIANARLFAEVEASRTRLRTILEHLPEAVLMADATTETMTAANRAAREMLGTPASACIPLEAASSHYCFERPEGGPLPPEELPLYQALHGSTVAGVHLMLHRAEGNNRYLLASAAPLYGPNGRVKEAVAVLTDVTALHELDKMKDEFISLASHELKSPLAVLKAYTQLLARTLRQEGSPTCQECLQKLEAIDAQADRMVELIERLLDFSRARMGRLELRLEPTDLVALARQVAEQQQVTTRRHRITVIAQETEIVGTWDRGYLAQALANLVGNAIKYSASGEICLTVAAEGNQATIAVRDQGQGIPEEEQDRVFERYHRGEAARRSQTPGLGIGLALSREIARAHGGDITVQSQPGKGSTFTLQLPL